MSDSSKTNLKKAINIIVLIVGGLLVAFLGFVYIGNAAGLGIAKQVAEFLDNNLGIVISWSGLLGIVAAYRKLASMDISNDSIKKFAQSSYSELAESKNKLDEATVKLEEKVEDLTALEKEVDSVSKSQKETNEQLGQMFDILLYFVLNGSENQKVEELKAYFQQSDLMKSITEMKKATSDNATSDDMVDAAINVAANEIKKAKQKIYKS